MGYIVGLNLEGAGDMADGSNGHSADGMALPPETVKFRIGGMDLDVPEIMFGDAEALRKPLDDIGPTQHWMDYANSVIEVIAHQMREKRPDLDADINFNGAPLKAPLKVMACGGVDHHGPHEAEARAAAAKAE